MRAQAAVVRCKKDGGKLLMPMKQLERERDGARETGDGKRGDASDDELRLGL